MGSARSSVYIEKKYGGVTYEDIEGRLSSVDVKKLVARPLLKDIISNLQLPHTLDHSLKSSIKGLEKRATDQLFDKHVEEIMRHFENVEAEHYRSQSSRAYARAKYDAECLREGGIAQFW